MNIVRNKHIDVASHRGMVGGEIVQNLKHRGYQHIITRAQADLDWTDQEAVRIFLKVKKLMMSGKPGQFGCEYNVSLADGLRGTYQDFLENHV